MTPIGPYISEWTDGEFFVVSTVVDKQIVLSFVLNGVQAKDGYFV